VAAICLGVEVPVRLSLLMDWSMAIAKA